MNRLLLIILFPLLFASSLCNAQSWHIINSPTYQNLARLDMISPSSGWAVSYDGLILNYDGQTWQIADSLRQFIERISLKEDSIFTDKTTIGDIYTVRLQNEQNIWIAVNHLDTRVYKLIRFDPKRQKFWSGLFPLKIRALDFYGDTFGVAVGEGGGFIYKNGLWSDLRLPTSADLRSVKIISPDNIFICGEKGIILKGGREWTIIESPVQELLRDLDFVSPHEGWFVGFNGTLLHYLNGVVTQEPIGSKTHLWAIDMLSSEYGFAVGGRGVILRYDGKSWQKFPSPTNAGLQDIKMLDEKTGFIVGQWGTILKFSTVPQGEFEQHRFLLEDQVYYGSATLIDRIDDVQGVTLADFNGDNLPDIYFTCYKSINHLLINRGDGYYIDRVIESGTGGNIETRGMKRKIETGAIAADFDRDNDVDLLLCGKRGTTRLLINNGKAVFYEATKRSNLPDDLNINDGTLGDFNEDGYPDFILADENKGIRIFINKKYNRFLEQQLDSLNLPLACVRAVKTGDFNNDNHQDILAMYHHFPAVLLLNDGASNWQKSEQPFLKDMAQRFVNSISVADFNNDGHSDFYLCTENGKDALYVYDVQGKTFVNESHKWGIKQGGRSYSAVAGDFDLDGDVDVFISRFGPDFLYLNQHEQKFEEVAQQMVYAKAGYLSGYNTGAATADIDADGNLELIVGNLEFWSALLKVIERRSGYLLIRLMGTTDTYEALGAKIWVFPHGANYDPDKLIAYREVNPSAGLFSQNCSAMHIGLGERDSLDIKIRFLGGEEKFLTNVLRDSIITVYQTDWAHRTTLGVARKFSQIMHIPQVPLEILKFSIFIVFLLGGIFFIEKRYRWRTSHLLFYMLILLIVYSLLIMLLRDFGGAVYHVFPVGVIFFTLMISILINEQTFKSNRHYNMIQDKIQKASTNLSGVKIVDEAIDIVVNTLKIIVPYDFFALYLYNSNSNYFLCKKVEGIEIYQIQQKIAIKRKKIDGLMQEDAPLTMKKFKSYCPEVGFPDSDETLVFPLVRKNRLLGIFIYGGNSQQEKLYPQNISMINYLFLQLAIAIDNIRILQNLEEQQKLAAIGTFASGIIHDLKNPIEGLRMIIEIMYNEIRPDNPYYEYIKELSNGIKELKQKLINSFDVVNYKEKIGDKVAINDLIRDIAFRFEKTLNVNIQLQLDKRQIIIRGDRNQLRYAVENLIQNAVEASNYEKPVIIRTKLNRRDETVRIDVIDKGIGIAVENLDKIFNMFYSTRGTGRGLGLTITRNIIENNSGYIKVFSDIDDGTMFSVILPV